ncbi:MAG: methionine--tRNA ligase subunit beta [Candidatus Paceibacterota bacterium]
MKEKISFEDFVALDLRVALIKSAELIEGSSKLVRLQVDVGEETERQIIAGIAKKYSPEDLIGEQVTVLSNLEPREIYGYESNGMILAVGSENGPVLISPQEEVKPGSPIS